MGWDLWLGEVEQGVEGIKELREYTEINGWNLVESRKMEKMITFSLIYLFKASTPDVGKGWRQKEKRVAEDEVVG